MSLWLRLGLTLWLWLSASSAGAATLLWLTTDITPAPRTAMVERLGRAEGFQVRHVEFALRDAPAADLASSAAVKQALSTAAIVWIDAPHATALARLQRMLGPMLSDFETVRPGRLAWVQATDKSLGDTASRMATYLQAGGEANTRHALTLARALVAGRTPPDLPPPTTLPARGLYHPQAPALFDRAEALAAWQASQPELRGRPPVVVLVHRYHFVNGSTDWLDAWLRAFGEQGLFAYAAFGSQTDAQSLSELLETDGSTGRLHARVIVTHQLLPLGSALQPLFERWSAPVIATQPWRSGDTAQWETDATGLPLGDVPFYLAQLEAAGAIDPLVVVAHGDQGRQPRLIERQAQAVVAKARRLIALQQKAPADKRLVAMVYNYPPGGSNFGASFLNVPRSLEVVSQRLAQAGYTTQAVAEGDWITRLKPLLGAYYPSADLLALLEQGQAASLPLAQYRAWWDSLPTGVRERIERHWGPPERSRYVVTHRGARVFVIPRVQVGNLSVLPQPPREETLRHGQDPFMHRNRVPLSHHYLAVYLWARHSADALIHFGTHGTQEWAPGKARGLDVLDDALLPLGDLPVVYPYIVDNLGEALTAKRRGRALMVSHRTPAFKPAGFEARMAHMHELMHEWETADRGPTRQALERQLVAQFVEHRLHHDLGWSAERIAADFEGFLEQLHPWLDQLAQSSQPQGLAVFGRVPAEHLRRLTLLQALRKPLIDALGEDIDEAFLIDHEAVSRSRPARWLDVALRDAQAASTLDLRPPEPEGPVPNRAARQPIDSAALLKLAKRAQALEKRLATEGELPGLLAALEGRFLPAAYGGDPIRNPDSLPTGRNLTGLDPNRLPTRQAWEVAQGLFEQWLKDWRDAHRGQTPARLALTLWAGETLRHQGVMEAQALVALGVQPVWDESGRPTGVRVIPTAELGRPRVDVLLSVTGSYRDQFPALMALIDRAVAAAAQAEPDNVIRQNTAAVTVELRQRGVPSEQAALLARARVFGNAPGDYGTGISDAVQADGLRRDDTRLGSLFLQRMSQPYLDGVPLKGPSTASSTEALGAHLRRTEAALLSRSSHLYAMLTSDDPFQYLGGLAAAARSAGRREGLELYVNELQDASEPTTQPAARSIALEMQSRVLHPGWLQAQQAEGYAGTLQVLKAVQFAWGWQATEPGSVRPDHWQSLYEVLVQDRHRLGLPQWLRSHPQAFAQTLERLIQAERLGHWRPSAQVRQEMANLYVDLSREAPLSAELAGVRRWVDAVQKPVAAPLPPPPPETSRDARPPVTGAAPRSGIRLQRVEPLPPAGASPHALEQALALVLMLSVAAAGAAWQAGRGGRDGSAPPSPRDLETA